MKTAFIIFDRMTALDFIGVYDPLTRLRSMDLLADFEWDICAFTKQAENDKGLQLTPQKVGGSLDGYDLIVLPGGFGTRTLQHDSAFIDWLRTAHQVPLKASVCTGALLLGAAGFLSGKKATTHRNAFDSLTPYCQQVVDRRIVDEGEVVTARGVTSSIDLGLHLVRRFAGPQAASTIARQMDYPFHEA